jgi:lipopolysaccharide export system protein LptA
MTVRARPQRTIMLAVAGAASIALAFGALAQTRAAPKPPPPPAQQGPPNALQGFSQNRNLPVNIKSISLEVRDRNKMATFTGDVHLVQGDTTMRCKTLVVFYDGDTADGAAPAKSAAGPASGQQIRRMEAKGEVVVTQKDQIATGDSAIYDMKENTVRLYAPAGGLVAVSQGPNTVKGPRLVVHLDTGVSQFEGGVELNAMPKSGPPK